MISFILIGKNEGRTIDKTIKSIYQYIEFNRIDSFEIIYVDSKSTDESIEIVKNFKEVKVFEITGEINAAIARNIGAKESKGDVLVFLDADMEIEKTFHDVIFKNQELVYPFVSGQLKNIYHNTKWEVVDEAMQEPNLHQDKFFATTGGYFIIDREAWFSVGGMKTKYRRTQDYDLGLRLAKQGILLLRKKELFVKHHTIHYENAARMWRMLFDGSLLYQTSVLYRDHIANKYIYKIILRENYTLLILIMSLILSFVSPLFLLLHPFSVLIRVGFRKNIKGNGMFIKKFIYTYLKDIFSFFGFFLFFPKSKKITYIKN